MRSGVPGRRPAVLATALLLLAGSALAAQERAGEQGGESTRADRQAAANALLSLALPGAGQLREGQDRGWAYLALEAAGWAVWAERRHRAGELRTRYRDLAWEEGRIQRGSRSDGDFPYYERLATWERSGAFDADPSREGLQPEMDPATYNGSIWRLAQGLFLPPGPVDPTSPGYGQALAYYRERAYGEAFLWDWSGNPASQDELGDLIEASDDRFRQATVVLGAVLANHLASAVDAWLSTSLDIDHTELRVHPTVYGPPGAWSLSLHIGALP